MPQTQFQPATEPGNQQSPSTASTPHCRHRTKQNRQCRLPILDTTTGLCFRHASLRNNEVDAGDLSAELLGEINDFTHAGQVKAFLSRLLIQIVRNRIAVKRAAVLTYISAQILRAFREMDYEDKLSTAQEQPTFFINDLPRPIRPAPKPEPPAVPEGLSLYANRNSPAAEDSQHPESEADSQE